MSPCQAKFTVMSLLYEYGDGNITIRELSDTLRDIANETGNEIVSQALERIEHRIRDFAL
jgi:ribosomal protein L18E